MSIARTSAAAFALAASLALAGCGSSDKADEAVTADSVEIPAEQALSTVDAAPVADSAAASAAPTTPEGMAAAAQQAAADVAAAAGEDLPEAKKPAQ